MTMNTISSSIAVISNIIIVTVVPITTGIILSTDDGTLLALAVALAVINWELVDVVDITIAQRANHKITNNYHYLMTIKIQCCLYYMPMMTESLKNSVGDTEIYHYGT